MRVVVVMSHSIEAISPRLKTRTGRRRYVVIVRDHHQLRIELREP